uniref:Uncharacterized protein n=1 Tax=Amphimedon queenslandica TaxID=400682 RepID=A0A1X7SFR3_AMPQE
MVSSVTQRIVSLIFMNQHICILMTILIGNKVVQLQSLLIQKASVMWHGLFMCHVLLE